MTREQRPLRLLADGLAVYRLTRLATEDTITQPVRDRIIEAAYTSRGTAERMRSAWEEHNGPLREGDWQQIAEQDPEVPPKLATLVTCRWCAGMHVAMGVILLRWLLPRFWRQMSDMLALSAAAALLARLEE